MGTAAHAHHSNANLPLLVITALGVVYGDIGTSPLYALRECFSGSHGLPMTELNIMGVLSLITWALILTVSIKYMLFILNADNRGEGGVMSLMALALLKTRKNEKKWLYIALGLFGSALLFGDGIVTPAITVLGAVEGLEVITPFFSPYVLPISVGILILFFLLQSRGTHKIGVIFGPVILTYFLALAALGSASVLQNPAILSAINPEWAVRFFAENKGQSFVVLGSVFLVVTGGESLYADMGHFGKRPIKVGWFAFVLPALFLNYMGQGALLLRDPKAISHPFFHLAPNWALFPLVLLSTLAAAIASQAVVSGVFSLARQAIQLGYFPRLNIVHTSKDQIGQIYVPGVNWALMVATIWLVLEFRTSSSLAAAYGIAVATTMLITTFMATAVARKLWGWGLLATGATIVGFGIVDLLFFSANALKIAHGGWFPLAIAAAVYTLMATWRRGRQILVQRLREQSMPLKDFLSSITKEPPPRVTGTAIFMTGNPEGAPPALVHNLEHNKILHEQVILLTVTTEKIPAVAPQSRVTVEFLADSMYRMSARYGFMETPNIYDILKSAALQGLKFKLEDVTFFLGRETLIPTDNPGMARWREHLFAFMSQNAQRATAFFQLPPNQVVEIGIQIEL